MVKDDPGVNGPFLFHDGSNNLNFAYAVVAPGVKESYFAATNVGGEEAAFGLNEALVGLFQRDPRVLA